MNNALTKQIRQLADTILADRVDARLLRPALVCQLTVAVRDFLVVYPPEQAEVNLKRFALVSRDPRFRKVESGKSVDAVVAPVTSQESRPRATDSSDLFS